MRSRRISRLTRALVLERRTDTADGGGGLKVGWQAVCTLWAEVRPLSAREVQVGVALSSRVSHRITLRRVPEPSAWRPYPADRLREGGRVFAIHGVAEEPGGAFLTVWAEEGAVP